MSDNSSVDDEKFMQTDSIVAAKPAFKSDLGLDVYSNKGGIPLPPPPPTRAKKDLPNVAASPLTSHAIEALRIGDVAVFKEKHKKRKNEFADDMAAVDDGDGDDDNEAIASPSSEDRDFVVPDSSPPARVEFRALDQAVDKTLHPSLEMASPQSSKKNGTPAKPKKSAPSATGSPEFEVFFEKVPRKGVNIEMAGLPSVDALLRQVLLVCAKSPRNGKKRGLVLTDRVAHQNSPKSSLATMMASMLVELRADIVDEALKFSDKGATAKKERENFAFVSRALAGTDELKKRVTLERLIQLDNMSQQTNDLKPIYALFCYGNMLRAYVTHDKQRDSVVVGAALTPCGDGLEHKATFDWLRQRNVVAFAVNDPQNFSQWRQTATRFAVIKRHALPPLINVKSATPAVVVVVVPEEKPPAGEPKLSSESKKKRSASEVAKNENEKKVPDEEKAPEQKKKKKKKNDAPKQDTETEMAAKEKNVGEEIGKRVDELVDVVIGLEKETAQDAVAPKPEKEPRADALTKRRGAMSVALDDPIAAPPAPISAAEAVPVPEQQQQLQLAKVIGRGHKMSGVSEAMFKWNADAVVRECGENFLLVPNQDMVSLMSLMRREQCHPESLYLYFTTQWNALERRADCLFDKKPPNMIVTNAVASAISCAYDYNDPAVERAYEAESENRTHHQYIVGKQGHRINRYLADDPVITAEFEQAGEFAISHVLFGFLRLDRDLFERDGSAAELPATAIGATAHTAMLNANELPVGTAFRCVSVQRRLLERMWARYLAFINFGKKNTVNDAQRYIQCRAAAAQRLPKEYAFFVRYWDNKFTPTVAQRSIYYMAILPTLAAFFTPSLLGVLPEHK